MFNNNVQIYFFLKGLLLVFSVIMHNIYINKKKLQQQRISFWDIAEILQQYPFPCQRYQWIFLFSFLFAVFYFYCMQCGTLNACLREWPMAWFDVQQQVDVCVRALKDNQRVCWLAWVVTGPRGNRPTIVKRRW